MMHLSSCEFHSLELKFCYPSLNLGCGYFLGKAQNPLIHRGVSHTLPWTPWTWETGFHLRQGYLGVTGRWSGSPSASQRQVYYFNPGSYQSDRQGSQLVPKPSLESFVQPRLALQCTERESPSIGWTGLLVLGGTLSQLAREDKFQWQGGENTVSSKCQMSPHKCYGNLEQTQDTKAFHEAIFISVQAVAQWIHIQRLSPKNKGVSPYKQVTESKSKV
jgi:hypothetical protein